MYQYRLYYLFVHMPFQNIQLNLQTTTVIEKKLYLLKHLKLLAGEKFYINFKQVVELHISEILMTSRIRMSWAFHKDYIEY